MPTFMDSLAANPNINGASASNIYGMPAATTNNDALSLVNRLKDREMMDFKNKANFMADLSLNQERRMRSLFDPSAVKNNNVAATPGSPGTQNVLPPQQAQGQISPAQNAELDLEKQKLAQSGKLGQEAQDTRKAQEQLNQQKSDQIHQQKIDELNQKTEAANQKLTLAQQALADKTKTAEEQLQAHKDLAAAMEERHKLELAQKDAEYNKTREDHQRSMDIMEEKLKQASHTTTDTTINPDGTSKTVDVRKGSAADTVQVKGKDGKIYTIPKDKADDKDSDGTPHWTPIGGEE